MAEADLLEIWEYLADRNLASANRVNAELGDACEFVGLNPLLGEVFDPDRQFLRRFTHDNYVVYYQTSTDPVTIVRVLHGARDTTGLV